MAYINGKKILFSPNVIIKKPDIITASSTDYRGYKNFQISTEALDVTKSYTLWVGSITYGCFDVLQNQTPVNNAIEFVNQDEGNCVKIYFNKSHNGTALVDKTGCISVQSWHLADPQATTDYYITLI